MTFLLHKLHFAFKIASLCWASNLLRRIFIINKSYLNKRILFNSFMYLSVCVCLPSLNPTLPHNQRNSPDFSQQPLRAVRRCKGSLRKHRKSARALEEATPKKRESEHHKRCSVWKGTPTEAGSASTEARTPLLWPERPKIRTSARLERAENRKIFFIYTFFCCQSCTTST